MGSLPPKPRCTAKSVCIIGAGPTGLAAAKYLLAERAFSPIVIFEQRDNVGGLWNHVPVTNETSREHPIPQTNASWTFDQPLRRTAAENEPNEERVQFMSPVYDRLETNIPRGLMDFSDLDWPGECQLFPGHEEVLRYIEEYAQDVQHLVQFCTQVLGVRLDDEERWKVRTRTIPRNGQPSRMAEHTFDAVVVANGHFNVPFIPDVQGIQRWNEAYPDSIFHSRLYRRPEEYTDKKVIVVGNSASGVDIAAQVLTTCRKPLLMSQKSESYLQPDPSPTQIEKPEIVEYITKNRSVRFSDGSVESDIDAVLYCTGYFYSFPFLESLDPPLITDGERVNNLYQHIFYRPHPTLVFPVLNQKVIPFPLAEAQSAVIARVFSGRLELPNNAEMAAWEEERMTQTGGGRTFHVLLFPKDAEYINMLHDWALSARNEVDRGVTRRAEDQNGDEDDLEKRLDKGNATSIGKEPPRWGEKEYWTRERFPAIKKAFQKMGGDRHSKRTLESVGFDFEAWRRNTTSVS